MIKTRLEQFSLHWTCASFAGLAFLAGCAATTTSSPKTTGWIKDEVADSYVFGYPLVMMETARDAAVGSDPGQTPMNTLRVAQALPPVGSTNPPTPGIDTLDSTGWLDLADGPVILTMPNSRGRYVDARVLDMWTNVVWSTSVPAAPRVTGVKEQTIAFVGPGWKGALPESVTRVDVPTRNAWVSVRVQSNGGRDLAVVRKLQRGIRLAPLAVYTGDAQSASAGSSSASDAAPVVAGSGTPASQVAALDAGAFFDRLAQGLKDNPPVPDDPHALKFLADLGVTPGAPVALPGHATDAIAAGLSDGHERVAAPPPNLLNANGWSWFGDSVGSYGPDYALRAYAAYSQLGIGTKDDEVRAAVSLDSDGHRLNGANRYVIHFASNQLPPVRGFWSITAYTKDGALGDSGPARLVVGDRYSAHRNRDGSLDVTVSAAKARTANWLPAPRTDIQLVLRLYAPKSQATDGTWQPPAVVRQ